jgi:hypothetical protein
MKIEERTGNDPSMPAIVNPLADKVVEILCGVGYDVLRRVLLTVQFRMTKETDRVRVCRGNMRSHSGRHHVA